MNAQPKCAERWQAGWGWAGGAQALGTVACQECADGRLVERRDLEVEIGQVAAALMDEHLAIEVVVEWTQFDQTQAPRHQA